MTKKFYNRKFLLRLRGHFIGWKTRSKRLALALLLLILLLPLILLAAPNSADAAWYGTSWKFRKKLTINEGQVSGSSNLTNFPVLISLVDTNLITAAQSDGDDIMFTSSDGTTKIDHEIETYTSSTGTLVAWVEVPTLDHNDDTIIYMYYGNNTATNQENITGVWSNHAGVWHLDAAPANGVTGHLNSATNTNDGTPQNFGGAAGTTTDATGKIDGADYFDGSNDYVSITDSSSLSFNAASSYTWSAWVNRDTMGADWEALLTQTQDNDTYVEFYTGDLVGDATWGSVTDGVVFGIQSSAGNYEIAHSNNNVLTTGTWYHVAVVYTPGASAGSKIKIYVNGSDVTNTGDTATSGTLGNVDPANHRISENAEFPGENTDGILDEVRMATTTRSADWLLTEYNNQNSPSTFFRTSPQMERPDNSYPALHWAFNEGNGTTANDSGRYSSNTGTTSGPTWQTEDMCIHGKCLRFDGSNDLVSKTYSSDTDLDPGNSGFTISSWFKHSSTAPAGGTTDALISRADGVNGVGYKLYMNSSGQLCFGIDASAGSFPSDSACSTTSYADSQWHFVEGVKSGTSSITLYIDGVQITQDASLTATTSISGSSSGFRAGIDADGTSSPWDGFIDEVKYFDHTRTASQIQADYNARGGVLGSSVQLGDAGTSFLNKGLVGYWPLDENTGSSTTDKSGNGFTGTLTNGATWAVGKFGSAGSFDGGAGPNADVIMLGDPTPNPLELTTFTLSGWIYRSGACQFSTCPIISKGMNSNIGYSMELFDSSGYKLRLTLRDGLQTVTGTTTIATNTWYHVAASIDGTTVRVYVNGVLEAESAQTQTPNFGSEEAKIGNRNSNNDITYNGRIDDVRAYNRVLSDQEIRALYEWAPGPKGHWKFDEKSGDPTDSSGNGYAAVWEGTNISRYKPGKFGGAGNFTGSSTERAYLGTTTGPTMAGIGSGTVMAWIYANSVSNDPYIYNEETNSNGFTRFGMQLLSTGKLQLVLRDSAQDPTGTSLKITGTTTLSTGRWYHIAVTYDSINDIEKVYINGVDDQGTVTNGSATISALATTDTKGIAIGCNGRASSCPGAEFNGLIDDVRLYSYARTTKQIVSDMNAGHPSVGSPVASAIGHWKFDEGYGTTANNVGSGGSTINGTLTSMATGSLASGWTNVGKLGKGMGFDGNNDQIDAGTNGVLNNTTNTMTISFWAQKAVSTEEGYIVARGTSGASGYGVGFGNIASSGCTSSQITASKFGTIHECIGSVPADTLWHHYTVVWDGSGSRAYLDGKLSSGTGSNTANFVTSSNNFRIGTHPGAAQDFFKGTLDEVKVYNYALSADEAKVEYNQGKSMTLGSASINADGVTASNSAQRAYCPPGNAESNCAAGSNPAPVLEWQLDERTGTSVNDNSGNGFTGTFGGDTAWTTGKVGPGLDFDGNNDYVTYNDTGASALDMSSSWTVEAWVKLDVVNVDYQTFIMKHNTITTNENYWLGTANNAGAGRDELYCEHHNSGGTTNSVSTTTFNLTTGRWYHTACVFDDTANTLTIYVDGVQEAQAASTITPATGNEDFFIGATTDPNYGDLDGKLDLARVYGYARSTAQIAWDYNRGGPVGWWKFDECSGTTAYDASGKSNNGTITPGAGSNTSAGTCNSGTSSEMWNDGTTGKFNGSLGFDNTDDYVSIPNTNLPTGDFTYSAWFKSSGNSDTILTVNDSSGNAELALRRDSTATLEVRTNNTVRFNTTTIFVDNTWYHVLLTRSGSTLNGYINGRLEGTATDATALTYSCPLLIGLDFTDASCGTTTPTQPIEGQIDDVRVYNYPLTAAQIKTLYNDGAAVRFGPNAGTP